MEEIKITFFGNPRSKKNSSRIVQNRKTGVPFLLPSEQYKHYEQECIRQIGVHNDTIDYPVNVECVYYMETRRRVDLVNLLNATLDILVRANVLADDNRDIVAGNDNSRVYYDKQNPRVEITITPMEMYEKWKE